MQLIDGPRHLGQVPSLARGLLLLRSANPPEAANPELESNDSVCEIPEPSVQACLAAAVHVHVVALECSLPNV